MAEEQFFLPESRYQPTRLDNWEQDPQAHIGTIVHVMPNEYLSSTQTLTVSGKNFMGVIDNSELSIYPITYFEKDLIPKMLPKMFGRCITAKIIGFSNSRFILSRKSSMQDALAYLKIGNTVEARIISCLDKKAFVDIGAGINAILPIKEVATIYLESLIPIFENVDYITAKIIAESSKHPNKFVVSSKQLIPQKEIERGDIVLGKAVNMLPDMTGVFVELSPTQTGIVDTDNLIVVGKDNAEEYFNADIVLGRTYSFLVTKVRPDKHFETVKHYSLRLL